MFNYIKTRKWNNLYRFILIGIVLLSAQIAFAQTVKVTVDDIKYTVDLTTKEATVAQQSRSLSKNNLVIPDFITYDGKEYPVTTIGDYAF